MFGEVPAQNVSVPGVGAPQTPLDAVEQATRSVQNPLSSPSDPTTSLPQSTTTAALSTQTPVITVTGVPEERMNNGGTEQVRVSAMQERVPQRSPELARSIRHREQSDNYEARDRHYDRPPHMTSGASTLEAMQQRIRELEAENQEIRSREDSYPHLSDTSANMAHEPRLSIGRPDKYRGDQGKVDSFLAQCQAYMGFCP